MEAQKQTIVSSYQHLVRLHNNPFIFAPVFSSFYDVLGDHDNSFLLSPLILPMVLYPESRGGLTRANSTSTLRTFLRKKGRIAGLQHRIREYSFITQLSMQHLVDLDLLSISNEMKVTMHGSVQPVLQNLIKPAKRLAIFFSEYDVPTIYRYLGVSSYEIND